ncbi:hypothetical protein GCG54_00012191 [Colletotrichum gloeosporioides]|uniref:Heterokaryon incompatibility protein n=1 Tax=Colletotrichum gloeosporioides TaxID=474922 RepID=A0A8H4CJA5_COLGL|nr:uncharacterized protein GCG54_00012191 [Colletotrichum gloeosporioides]KAF3804702.1 hypothetical protein GCG54_00012191 [Colletotrichum gloeosporioides]
MSITQIKFHATDQRDKIYGLLGLAAESRDPPGLPDSLRPDYSLSVAEVYLKVARYVLNEGSSLALLTRARGVDGSLTGQKRQHRLDLPTWAPDWSDFQVFNRDIRTSLAWVDYADTYKKAQLGFPDHYSATTGLSLKLHPPTNPSTLRVNGIRIDCVKQAMSFATENFGKQLDWEHLTSQTVRLLKFLMSTGIADGTLEWVIHLIKVTTVDQHRLGGRDFIQSIKDGLAFIYEVISETQNDLIAGVSSLNKDFLNRLRQHSIGGIPREYAALAVNYCFDRSFLVTSSGRMAIGPSETQVRDTIAVVPGSGVPYVIRQRGSSWALVGESYVQGLMKGEAIESLRDGTVQEEILGFQ